MKYGFVRPVIETDHYILGSSALPRVVVQPSGQWDDFLPDYEPQFNQNYDTDGCAVWGTENAIEIFGKKITGRELNYSERFIYILAGVRPPGADPHHIAEVIRANGLIDDSELPMTNSFSEFLKPNPMTSKYLGEGKGWLNVFEFGHEWLFAQPTTKDNRIKLIKEALQYSPVAISVSAWHLEGDIYVDAHQPNCHWCVCFGWDDDKQAWKVFDSYDQSIKLYSFDSMVDFAKRYHLVVKNKDEQISLIKRIIQAITDFITMTNHSAMLDTFCAAIRDYEGGPSDRNFRNNNPGNCRYSPVGYSSIYGSVGKDKDGFAIFKDYATGWLYLENLVKEKIKQHPDFTIEQFFSGVPGKWSGYAPSADGNNPTLYALFVEKRLGVGADFIISKLLA